MHDKRKRRADFIVSLGYPIEEAYDWIKLWAFKKQNARQIGVFCRLTFEEFVTLAKESGITTRHQIGTKPGDYQLGRIGDTGDYVVGRCRFITKEQNTLEKIQNGGTERQASQLRGKPMKRKVK